MSNDPADPAATISGAVPPIDRLAIWQVIADRRSSYDSMMWQTPSLGLTAQAFLLTLALGADVSKISRVIAALLSFIISIMVLQLMSKHRHFEGKDSRLLEWMERGMGFEDALEFTPHAKPEERYPPHIASTELPHRKAMILHYVVSKSSYLFWMTGQSLFAIIALYIIGTVVAGHDSVFAVVK